MPANRLLHPLLEKSAHLTVSSHRSHIVQCQFIPSKRQNHKAKAWYRWTIELTRGEPGPPERSISVLVMEKMGGGAEKIPEVTPLKEIKAKTKARSNAGPKVPIIYVAIE